MRIGYDRAMMAERTNHTQPERANRLRTASP